MVDGNIGLILCPRQPIRSDMNPGHAHLSQLTPYLASLGMMLLLFLTGRLHSATYNTILSGQEECTNHWRFLKSSFQLHELLVIVCRSF